MTIYIHIYIKENDHLFSARNQSCKNKIGDIVSSIEKNKANMLSKLLQNQKYCSNIFSDYSFVIKFQKTVFLVNILFGIWI